MAEEVMTKQQAATYLHISVATLERWMRGGVLPVVKLRGRRRVLFRKPALDAVLRANDTYYPPHAATIRKDYEDLQRRQGLQDQRLQRCRNCGERIEQPGRRQFWGQFSMGHEEGDEATLDWHYCADCITVNTARQRPVLVPEEA